MIDLVAEQSPLGGLDRWLADPAVTEVLVNRGTEVWVERFGRLAHVATMRSTTVDTVVERILAPTGRRLDRSQPMVDTRLADGTRVCVAIPPVAVDGTTVALRRFAARSLPLAAFCDADTAALLGELVGRRDNLVVSGPTSSGKTTLLNTLAHLAPTTERFVTLEDTAELRLEHPHVVRLETRDPTPDGVGAVTLDDLLRTALRLRPDRLVVGEVRGSEAIHLLQAMNTGHDGSLSTIHANSAGDALARLASLVSHEAPGWPLAAVHDHVCRAVDAVVHVGRRDDGTRRIDEIAEVLDVGLTTRSLFVGGRVVASPHRRRR